MRDENKNPFASTQAVSFTDQEILQYWVDFKEKGGLVSLFKPTSKMPMFIIGGKGSGKTHLMRYLSCAVQCARYPQETVAGVTAEHYIGVYLRCGGLNAGRFAGKGQEDDAWSEVFSFYMDLWLAQLTLTTVRHLLLDCPDFRKNEKKIVRELLDLLDEPPPTRIKPTVVCFADYLRSIQRNLDQSVNNATFTERLRPWVCATRGRLVFGVPEILCRALAPLRDCILVYLVDELENLSASQQRYVQTLVREREGPCSLKIGARRYGIRSYETYSAGEENREGSEFETVYLDTQLRGNPKYAAFVKRLVAKRLSEHGLVNADAGSQDSVAQRIGKYFVEPPSGVHCQEEASFVKEKYRGRDRPYFARLIRMLDQADDGAFTGRQQRRSQTDEIISLLQCERFPFLEKVNTYLFYKGWCDGRPLIEVARRTRDECNAYLVAPMSRAAYKETVAHFKYDLLAQLLRECGQPLHYYGIDTFVDMSWGLPRALLVILKHVYDWAVFSGEKPFRHGPISLKAQREGLTQAVDWFYQDAIMTGDDGQGVASALDRLGELFRSIRFSDKPSECSCSTFSFNKAAASAEAHRVVQLAVNHSLLVSVPDQSDRNSERRDPKYQLNRMLAPKWHLSPSRRGAVALAPEEINAIFDKAHADDWGRLLKARVARMTAPFFGRRAKKSGRRGLDEKLLPGLVVHAS